MIFLNLPPAIFDLIALIYSGVHDAVRGWLAGTTRRTVFIEDAIIGGLFELLLQFLEGGPSDLPILAKNAVRQGSLIKVFLIRHLYVDSCVVSPKCDLPCGWKKGEKKTIFSSSRVLNGLGALPPRKGLVPDRAEPTWCVVVARELLWRGKGGGEAHAERREKPNYSLPTAYILYILAPSFPFLFSSSLFSLSPAGQRRGTPTRKLLIQELM
jgi:hypothetical protein